MACGACYSLSCLVVRFFILLAYLCVGAAVFRTLENGGEEKTTWSKKPEIEQYLNWFHFTFASTTTIGYGDVTPVTSSGKIFYIFYSMMGISLMLWYLALCGQIQTNIYAHLLQKIRTNFWNRNDKSYKDIGPVLTSFIMLLIFWFAGSIILHKTADMSLLNCIYYWWVTLSTTGFGDIVLRSKLSLAISSSWIVYKWFLLNLVAALVHSILVWVHGFSEPKQSICCMCWHPPITPDHSADTLARYNVQLAKKQELLEFHRHTNC